MKTKLLLILIVSIVTQYCYGQSENFWTEGSAAATSGRIGKPKGDQRYYDLNLQGLKNAVLQAPDRNARTSSLIVSFPTSDGQLHRFSVVSASVLPPELAAKYPGIYSFAGRDVDDLTSTIRFSVSDYNGVQGIILTTDKTTFIAPIENGNTKAHKVYSDPEHSYKFECKTSELGKKVAETKTTDLKSNANARATGPNLRTFRAAIATDPGYGDYYAGTGTIQQKRANILAQINGFVTQLNAIFERDLSVALQLVSNEDQILFFTGNSPLSGTTAQDIINNTIGAANYDLGHSLILNTEDGEDNIGNAGCIACICTTDKGLATSTGRFPSSSVFMLVVAHEMGHQMGAYHTQSASQCISGNGKSEVEPGSGSTIMAYAGICDPEVQANDDGYYNQISIRQIDSYVYTLACGTSTSTGNSAPTVNAGLDYTIPKLTPFVLTGQGSDPDAGDVLTYTWEQNDPQIYDFVNHVDGRGLDGFYPASTKTTGPMFRSYRPSTSPVRSMPNLQTARTDGPYLFEVLPSVPRVLNFVLTARDNHPGAGRVQFDSMKVTIANNSGPFDFSTAVNQYVWTAGSIQNILWNVAGTNTAPVNCQNVKISLSIDGGITFPYVLSASTANDGTENLTVPVNISSSSCRLKIEAIGNIFYALSNSDFTITAAGCVTSIPDSVFAQRVGTTTTLAWIRDNNTKYEIRYRKQGTSIWTTQSVADQPGNYLVWANINNLTAATTYEAQVHSLCDGGNTITVRARGVTGQEHINIKVGTTTIGSVTLTTSYQNYTYQTTLNGGIMVQYDNDQGSRDVQVDYAEVNGEIRQAEAQSYNTGAFLNGSCGGGGNSEWLNCNGSIGFDNVNRNNITIRARGTLGGEHINLRINNAIVANFTLGTTLQNYTATFTATGGITVEFDNDKTNSDVQVDYIIVNGIIRQAEAQSYNTAAFLNGSCGGGGFSEWMNCNGLIGFGNADLPGAGSSNWSTLLTFTVPSSDYHPDDINTLLGIDQFNNISGGSSITWKSNPNPATWEGVTWTTTIPKRVLSLELTADLLSGNVYAGGLPALQTLKVPFNNITSLNISGSSALTQLDCSLNVLTSLDLSTQTSLTNLDCSLNAIQQINMGTISQLVQANMSANQLSSINLNSLTHIQELKIYSNQLPTIDVSHNTTLTVLNCADNRLTSLNILPLTNLTEINCSLNQLTALNVTGLIHLDELFCGDNNIASITGLGAVPVTWLDATVNQMTSLNLHDNAELVTADVGYNKLTSITLPSPTVLNELQVFNNSLTQLDLTGQTSLVDLECSFNKLTNFTTTVNNLTVSISDNNNLPFTELLKVVPTFEWGYAPQNVVFTPVTSPTNVTINYSSQAVISGQTTTFKWYKNGLLVTTNTTGTFTTTGVGVYYSVMTNGFFTNPDLILTSAKTTIGNPSARLAEDPEAPVVHSAPEEVAAYPNPATNSIVINLPETPSQVVLYTTLGTPVVERSVEVSQITLDVSDTKPGIYILKISSGNHTYTQRIVIQH